METWWTLLLEDIIKKVIKWLDLQSSINGHILQWLCIVIIWVSK